MRIRSSHGQCGFLGHTEIWLGVVSTILKRKGHAWGRRGLVGHDDVLKAEHGAASVPLTLPRRVYLGITTHRPGIVAPSNVAYIHLSIWSEQNNVQRGLRALLKMIKLANVTY